MLVASSSGCLVCHRANTVFPMAAFPVVLMELFSHLAKSDQKYFRESREQKFGTTLEKASQV